MLTYKYLLYRIKYIITRVKISDFGKIAFLSDNFFPQNLKRGAFNHTQASG